ncbi:hypothetical protein [Devosia sp.]|uniref:hypothetical protein n=1 Tax=Devosia sp. TaxID=1871048 RepID=UPI002F212664
MFFYTIIVIVSAADGNQAGGFSTSSFNDLADNLPARAGGTPQIGAFGEIGASRRRRWQGWWVRQGLNL